LFGLALVSLRRRGARFAGLLACLLLGGCALEGASSEPSSHPAAGLYTPGNTLGASDPTDTPLPGAGLGDRCVPLPPFDPDAGVATPGELSVTYSTQTLEAQYSPRNCTAVWIETLDGAYVTALEVLGGLVGRPGLFYLADHACLEKLGPDVKTGATLADHTRAHSVRWRGADFEGKPVADGSYVLFIEVTESDTQPGEFGSFEIMKGMQPYEMQLPVGAEGALLEVTVAWAPDATGALGGR
jgi:hypothetical protein